MKNHPLSGWVTFCAFAPRLLPGFFYASRRLPDSMACGGRVKTACKLRAKTTTYCSKSAVCAVFCSFRVKCCEVCAPCEWLVTHILKLPFTAVRMFTYESAKGFLCAQKGSFGFAWRPRIPQNGYPFKECTAARSNLNGQAPSAYAGCVFVGGAFAARAELTSRPQVCVLLCGCSLNRARPVRGRRSPRPNAALHRLPCGTRPVPAAARVKTIY